MSHRPLTSQPDPAQPVALPAISRLRLVLLMGLLALFAPVAALACCDIMQAPFLMALALLLVSLQLTGLLLGAVVAPWRTPTGGVLRAIAWAVGLPLLAFAGGTLGLILWVRLLTAGLPGEAVALTIAALLSALCVGLVGAVALAPRAWWPSLAWRRWAGWAALVGLAVALAVALAGVGLWWGSTLPGAHSATVPTMLPTEEPQTYIVAARVDLPAGIVLSDTALLEVQSIPSSRYEPLQHLSSPQELEGAMLLSQVRASEPIRRDQVDHGAPVLVARVDIPAATVITDVVRLVRVRQVYGPQSHPERQFDAFEQIYGAWTVAPIAAGQPIERTALDPTTIPPAPPRPAAPVLVPIAASALAVLTLVMLRVELGGRPRQPAAQPSRATRRARRWRGLAVLLGLAGIVAASVLAGRGLVEVGRQPAVAILPTEVPVVNVVRARVDLPASIVITDTARLLETVSIPATELEPAMVTRAEAAQGAITRRPLWAGTVLRQADLFLPGDSAAAAPAVGWGNLGTVYVWLTGAGALLTTLLLGSQVRVTRAARARPHQ